MIRIFGRLCLLLSFGFNFGAFADQRRSLKIGLIEFNSLATIEGQEPEGLIVEYVRDILQAANLPLQYHSVSIGRSLEQLHTNRLDLVLMLIRTPERASYTRYSRFPLLFLKAGICTKTEIQKQALTPASRVAHVRGALVPPALRGLKRLPVSGKNSQLRMIQMLAKNRVDAIFSLKPEGILLAAHQAGIDTPLHCYELKNIQMAMHLGFAWNLPAEIVQKLDDALLKKLQIESFDSFLQRRMTESGIAVQALETIDPTEFQL
jgi:hypothetical protein